MQSGFWLKKTEDKLLKAAGNVLSKQEYDSVLDRAQRFSYRFTSITFFASMFAVVVLLPIGIYAIDELGLADWQGYLLLMLLLMPSILASVYVKKKEDRIKRKFFSKYMIACELRPDYCLICGYDLRASHTEQCPECGERLAFIENPDQS